MLGQFFQNKIEEAQRLLRGNASDLRVQANKYGGALGGIAVETDRRAAGLDKGDWNRSRKEMSASAFSRKNQ